MNSMTLKLAFLLIAIFIVIMVPTPIVKPQEPDDNPNYIKCTMDAQCFPYGLKDCKMIPQYVADDLNDMFSVCVVHNMCRWDHWSQPVTFDDCWDYYGKPAKYANDFAPEH